MSMWHPDPTFYPSPKMAMQAPAENAGLRGNAQRRQERPARPYGRRRSSIPLRPTTAKSLARWTCRLQDNELHHFGWNACSACLCPHAPHPHVERRYLVVPGIDSSRIHIIDTKPNPRNRRSLR